MNPKPKKVALTVMTGREAILFSLLCEARHWLTDKRLQMDEGSGRRQRENKQEHANRISDYMEQNEMLRSLNQRIQRAIQGEDDEGQDE